MVKRKVVVLMDMYNTCYPIHSMALKFDVDVLNMAVYNLCHFFNGHYLSGFS